ncbi:MAG: hypothetical protein ABIS45_12255, partial [Burkholderiales bacterium]
FDEIDLNRDGVVSMRELEQFLEKDGVAAAPKQAAANVAPAAATSNETPPAKAPTTATERAVDARMESRLEPRADTGAGGEPVPFALKKEFMGADANGDGFLTPQELRGRFPTIEKNFTAVDANADGRISLEEFWHFRRKIAGAARIPR